MTASRPSGPFGLDFARTPFTVIWEVTRACDLRCVHCRADAQPARARDELTTAEGRALLDQIRDLGSPVFVITGGDPLKRPDLFELIEYGVGCGLNVAVTPSGTPLFTPAAVARLADAGVKRIALSLDGPTAEVHDAFRQQPGSYGWTVEGIRTAGRSGLPVQINTTVTRRTRAYLPAMAALVGELGAVMWSVFFLVTVGRARSADQLDPVEYEEIFAYLYELSKSSTFAVRTTAAPHYRRYVLQQQRLEKRAGVVTGPQARVAGMVDMPRALRGVTDGNGLVFVAHTGEVYPSGFLPIRAGSIRETPLADLYREAPIFRRLRDTASLDGKCGLCEFRHVCGGSRARAFAVTGDPMAAEPSCTYEPGPAVEGSLTSVGAAVPL
ncbi:TIGR04053 family radical SAM/SPASM domain-containing protein [Candidatus Binatia bacterium]|nr:TIGR04053 family radical SAM/SPASM domain-containing protein [Candidatus Binatia bacterium]